MRTRVASVGIARRSCRPPSIDAGAAMTGSPSIVTRSSAPSCVRNTPLSPGCPPPAPRIKALLTNLLDQTPALSGTQLKFG